MGEQLPLAVCGHMLSEHKRPDSPAPVATDFSAELFYPGGVSASFYCSFRAEIQQWASISGTRGALYVSDFVLPYYGSELRFEVSNPVFHVTGCDFNMEEHNRRVAVREYSVPLRRVCVKLFQRRGIVVCRHSNLWRTAHGCQTRTHATFPAGGGATAI